MIKFLDNENIKEPLCSPLFANCKKQLPLLGLREESRLWCGKRLGGQRRDTSAGGGSSKRGPETGHQILIRGVIGLILYLPRGSAHGSAPGVLQLSSSYLPGSLIPVPKAASCEEKLWHVVCGVSVSHSRVYSVLPEAEMKA